MKPPISNQKVLAYLRLEEDEATVDLLTAASLRYLGAFATPRGPSHFWSFPIAGALAWAELNEDGTLTTPHEVPQAVRDATPERAEHHTKTTTASPAAAPSPLTLRAKPERAVWVPARAVPAYFAHDAWVEEASFDQALKHYGASAIADSRARTRAFHLQLTSGRYACIEWRRSHPQTVVIGLEVDTSCADAITIGKVFVRDIEEILQPMGGRFKQPVRQGLIKWSRGG
jgi:hypothetical protein